ncbi:fructan beta-fructosidase [Maribacter spongiicola]|uniref:Fructan beta-fructosidase n=1 Tax=Maribacter spongiicola TaxID=1206753 RepID=A0A4R7K074_9FLAO|nr:glycoside hydrolase family 32 protein [Maribacter spongiicola]TDT43816.1 fructan beta-fructosidase [Maribacter spongiicola]
MVKTLQNKGLAVFVLLCVIFNFSCKQEVKQELIEEEEIPTGYYIEKYRPQYHFTPEEKWMNDPNGLVYKDSVYHLFYQYYPDSTVWGPMHWGHAVSKDMMVWKHKPVALFPDENGFIFSGSAVVDHNNTSGYGTKDNPAMVAIFTYHDMAGEQAGKNDFQTQGIAYSLDNGDSWTKFENNPVIENTGIKDFRDPKVFWNDKAELWTMLLVAGDHLQIWNSPNLKEWKKVSEFGKETGAHGGVWECPDLFPLKIEGTDEVKWVLLISINPGAPNGGSGTQYFIGDFDGTTFTTEQVEHKWIDLGRDNYAGVTYNDTPNNERIFIGWMSNWDYARETPTEKWRSAMTVPRALTLRKVGDEVSLFNYPVIGFEKHVALAYPESIIKILPTRKRIIPLKYGNQSKIKFTLSIPNAQIYFRNKNGDSLSIDIDRTKKLVTLDRRKSGNVDFSDKFSPGVQQMKIPSLPDGPIEIVFLLDHSSLEIFINDGQYVMTNQIFPNEFFRAITIVNNSEEELVIEDFTEHKVERVWD